MCSIFCPEGPPSMSPLSLLSLLLTLCQLQSPAYMNLSHEAFPNPRSRSGAPLLSLTTEVICSPMYPPCLTRLLEDQAHLWLPAAAPSWSLAQRHQINVCWIKGPLIINSRPFLRRSKSTVSTTLTHCVALDMTSLSAPPQEPQFPPTTCRVPASSAPLLQ